MAARSKLLIVAAVVLLPARLYGQVPETTWRPTVFQPDPAAAVPVAEGEAPAAVPSDWRPCEAFLGCAEAPECHRTPQSIFLFGGQFTRGSMGDTADIFNVTYDNVFFAGLGYQRLPWTWRQFNIGWEIGFGNRFNHEYSAEVWGGAVVRHRGFTVADLVTVTASLTAGFSAVSESTGHEEVREYWRKGDASFLFYLGPEIALSTPRHPNVEVFYRLHHRCGGNQTLGDLSEGYNANCLGIRFKF
jgi:hypothetical protein